MNNTFENSFNNKTFPCSGMGGRRTFMWEVELMSAEQGGGLGNPDMKKGADARTLTAEILWKLVTPSN